MNRTARAFLTVLLVPVAAGGLVAIACRGGGPLGGDDGGFDGEAARQVPGTITTDGGAGSRDECATAIVAIEDNAATDNASSGGPGCSKDDECTVRFAGDYCACPLTPRPLLVSRAAPFDESLNGIAQRCTCPIPSCEPPPNAKAACKDSRCVLLNAVAVPVDAGD
ncbi:MAG: hypothetical protein KF795_11260 [Labilithrix sp.]|nr:hypothetical protein [Labilithrix sp.]